MRTLRFLGGPMGDTFRRPTSPHSVFVVSVDDDPFRCEDDFAEMLLSDHPGCFEDAEPPCTDEERGADKGPPLGTTTAEGEAALAEEPNEPEAAPEPEEKPKPRRRRRTKSED